MPDKATSPAENPTPSVADPAATTGGAVAAAPVSPPPSGTRYAVGEEIAHGGMGVVYRATDTVLGREVAVKVLAQKFGPESSAARRFADEARITGQLQHPAIPPVHDLGTLPDGRPFLAMKLIKGETLEELLADRPNPSRDRGRFVAAFEQVCQALAYAHSHRVIHRDLKPANVMVGSFGEVQVMDWGLAKVMGDRPAEAAPDPDETAGGTKIQSLRDSDGSLTQAGSVLGTPAFMPPEQAVGAVGKVDARSDVFGLGAILAVILTGQPPFASSSAETIRVKAAQGNVEECFARLDECGAEPDLVALCKRCLSPRQDDRPADAGVVAQAVAALRAAADERARRAELERVQAEGEKAAADLKAAEQRKRRRVQLALAAAVGLLLAAGGAFAWWQDRQAAAERDRRGRNAEAVAALLDRTEEALRAGDAAKAAALLEAVEERAKDGGVGDHAGRLDRLRADLAVSRDLDEVDQFRWTVAAGGRIPEGDAVAERYRAVFGRFGADPGTVPPGEAAARVMASSVRDRLVAALDRWLREGKSAGVRAVLRTADPNPTPFRDSVRDAVLAGDGARVAELARRADVGDQPAEFAAVLGEDPAIPVERRRELLLAAHRRRPGDMAVLMALGKSYPMNRRAGAAERVRWFQATVAVAPRNTAARSNLGLALHDDGDVDGAIAQFREALSIDRDYAIAHNNLGWALEQKGNREGAIAAYRAAIDLDPNSPYGYVNLSRALRDKGDPDGALAQMRLAIDVLQKAVDRNPSKPVKSALHVSLGFARGATGDVGGAIDECEKAIQDDESNAAAWSTLSSLLVGKGELNEAVDTYRKAVQLDSGNAAVPAVVHFNLGIALMGLGDLTGAEDAFRKAVSLEQNDARYHNNLGVILLQKEDFDGATAAVKEALWIAPELPGAAGLLHRIDWYRRLSGRLPGAIVGTDRPANRNEAYGFAELCWQPYEKRYAAAALLYERAFADDPELAAGLPHRARYLAGCCAVLAAGGAGVDAPTDPTERTLLRAKALSWLRTDLAARRRSWPSAKEDARRETIGWLTHWLTDPDMGAVRPGLRRIGMPDAERAAWDAFWEDVRATLVEAQKSHPPREVER